MYRYFLKHLIWFSVQRLFLLIRGLIWRISGITREINGAERGDQLEHAVHVRTIVARYYLGSYTDAFELPVTEDVFLTVHSSFEHTAYLLKANVTLSYITESHAYFVECEEEEDFLDSNNAAYLRFAQFCRAKKLLVTPLHAFQRFAESLSPVDEQNLVFISNTARCGSTLISQIFEGTGECVSVSQPDFLNCLATIKNENPNFDIRKLTGGVIRYSCKPLTKYANPRFVMTLTSTAICFIPTLHALYPRAKFLFLYRNSLKNIRGLNRCLPALPIVNLCLTLGRYTSAVSAKFFAALGIPDPPGKFMHRKVLSTSQFSALFWAASVRQYLDFYKKGIPIKAVKYDDLVQDPPQMVSIILKYTEVPIGKLDVSKIFSRDTERGTPLSRENLRRFKEERITAVIIKQIDNVLVEFGLPLSSEECSLPGTLLLQN